MPNNLREYVLFLLVGVFKAEDEEGGDDGDKMEN